MNALSISIAIVLPASESIILTDSSKWFFVKNASTVCSAMTFKIQAAILLLNAIYRSATNTVLTNIITGAFFSVVAFLAFLVWMTIN
jgi:hypothetical protein